jgi:photosystem II stability/assembly factor-like uncharacterized protein
VAVGFNYGASAVYSTNGGVSWSKSDLPSLTMMNLDSVWCSNKRACVAVGYNETPTGSGNNGVAVYSTNGGASWSVGNVPSTVTDLLAVACSTADACVALGTTSNTPTSAVSANGGKTWSNAQLPTGVEFPLGLTCEKSGHCLGFVVSTSNTLDMVTSPNTGSSWLLGADVGPVEGSFFYHVGITCPTALDCVLTSGSGGSAQASIPNFAYTSNNGGSSWSLSGMPAGLGAALTGGISCPSPKDCITVGNNGAYYSTNAGKTWSP